MSCLVAELVDAVRHNRRMGELSLSVQAVFALLLVCVFNFAFALLVLLLWTGVHVR